MTVLTCVPNFPKGKVFQGYRNLLWQAETVDGIRVVRVWSFIAANQGFFLRTLDYLSYMVSAVLAVPFLRRPDVVVATSPQFFTAVAGWVASRLRRVPFIFELRDLWPSSISAVGALSEDSLVIRLLTKLEMYLYRKADRIVSVTHSFKRDLVARGVPEEKICVITNGVDLTQFVPQTKDENLLEMYGLSGKMVVGYIGTHGMAHALETLLDAALILSREMKREDIHFLLIGDGANKRRLIHYAEENELDNVSFIDSVPKEVVVKYWALLDVSVIHLKKTPLFRTVIPSKIFESMAMGVPIALGVEGEALDVVVDAGAGIGFEPENPHALVNCLVNMAGDKYLRERMKKNGLEAAKRYSRERLANEMITVIDGANGECSPSKIKHLENS